MANFFFAALCCVVDLRAVQVAACREVWAEPTHADKGDADGATGRAVEQVPVGWARVICTWGMGRNVSGLCNAATEAAAAAVVATTAAAAAGAMGTARSALSGMGDRYGWG
jgi:hypothetical protein